MFPEAAVDVQRAADRFHTRTAGTDSRHCFSFGAHYDPDNTHFGLLTAINDEVVGAGHGFDPHPHRDVEIVTWVLAGTLEHADSQGRRGRVQPGQVQCLSAGSGVRHSERNGSATSDVHFVQMWVLPDVGDAEPGYAQRDVSAELAHGGLVAVASGRPEHVGAVPIRQRDATLHVARLRPGAAVDLPSAPWMHVHVAAGQVDLAGPLIAGPLGAGDSARITAADGPRLAAGVDGAEVLVWEMHSTLGRTGSGE